MTPAQKKIKAWREDPVLFVRDCFQVEPDTWQADVLRAFPKNSRIAMKSSKGVGKSTILAWCAWNFLATRPFPKMVASSISGENLADGLWAELSKWQQKSKFLSSAFTWTKTRIFANENPENWFLSARTWAKGADASQQANSLAGIHADYVLFILDEVGGFPDGVLAAAEAGLATGKESKIIMAGNPTHLEGPLYKACTSERHLWNVTEITSDPENPKRSTRVSLAWAREQIEKYGRDNPFVMVNVLGQFPPSSLNVLLGPDEVQASMNRHAQIDQYDFSQKRIGVDVSRFGDDTTCLFPRQGLVAFRPVIMRNANTSQIAARLMQAKSKWGSEMEFIDDTGGFGAGVIDQLMMAGQSPLGIHFAEKASDSRYYNKRAEMHFKLAEWVKRGGCLPKNDQLTRELTAATYTFKDGRLLIEPKDQIKSRLGFSPDMADALALTFALPDMPRSDSLQGLAMFTKNKMLSDYNPFEADLEG